MIIIGQDIKYQGRIIRTQEDGVYIIKDGEYVTACESIKDCKELIDWVDSQ
jgi:hypothetical protein